MQKVLLVLALIAGCGGDERRQESNGASPASGAVENESGSAPVETPDGKAGESGSLTGLFEGGSAGRPDQLCMIERGKATQFGLVVWGSNMHSCAGAGEAMRRGDTLRLTMSGDKPCTLEAKISGGTISLPDSVPEGCSYYCGARARLTGVTLARKGSRREDALKAKDLAGDPLCGGGAD